jgi:hypothetical protein
VSRRSQGFLGISSSSMTPEEQREEIQRKTQQRLTVKLMRTGKEEQEQAIEFGSFLSNHNGGHRIQRGFGIEQNTVRKKQRMKQKAAIERGELVGPFDAA